MFTYIAKLFEFYIIYAFVFIQSSLKARIREILSMNFLSKYFHTLFIQVKKNYVQMFDLFH